MSSESQSVDPYEAVIADLRAKRDQIDLLIQGLEAQRGGGQLGPVTLSAHMQRAPEPNVGDPGAFLGMTIADATKKLLQAQRKPLGNAEILAALKAGGLHMTSADPINTIGAVLTRRFNVTGDIVRVGRGIWGLLEWYPNRSFKKKTVTPDDAPSSQPEPAST